MRPRTAYGVALRVTRFVLGDCASPCSVLCARDSTIRFTIRQSPDRACYSRQHDPVIAPRKRFRDIECPRDSIYLPVSVLAMSRAGVAVHHVTQAQVSSDDSVAPA
eukprot:3961137-Prymnesium_polylepis.1